MSQEATDKANQPPEPALYTDEDRKAGRGPELLEQARRDGRRFVSTVFAETDSARTIREYLEATTESGRVAAARAAVGGFR